MDFPTSLEELQELFEEMPECDNWSIQLIKIRPSKRNGVSYSAREISLRPSGKLKEEVGTIAGYYTADKSQLVKKYEKIEEYDGVNIGNVIYRLPVEDRLISREYGLFVEAVNFPDTEGELAATRYDGYVISGNIGEGNNPVRLVSLQNPLTSYENKHRFICEDSSFKELRGNILQIKVYVDAVLYKGNCYMMSLNAERLFDMERSYKTICEEKVGLIEENGLVSDFGMFSQTAKSGHNPRKFVSFNQSHFETLAGSRKVRKELGKKFEIPLTDEGAFDTSEEENSSKLVKLLCDKAMLEPFEQNPMEVEAAKTWR